MVREVTVSWRGFQYVTETSYSYTARKTKEFHKHGEHENLQLLFFQTVTEVQVYLLYCSSTPPTRSQPLQLVTVPERRTELQTQTLRYLSATYTNVAIGTALSIVIAQFLSWQTRHERHLAIVCCFECVHYALQNKMRTKANCRTI
jgi:hypothetical protein